MKDLKFRAFMGTMLVVFMLAIPITTAGAASITKTLDEDTQIATPGLIASQWGNGMPMFKKGTVVTLNDNGEVLEGILASYTMLPCVSGPSFYFRWSFANDDQIRPNRILGFKGGTKVTFNARGEVVKGTVVGGFIEVPVSQSSHIGIVENTEISFHENGMIASCVVSNDTFLRPVGWRNLLNENNTSQRISAGLVQFKKNNQLVLNDKCEVIKGTLNIDTKLLSSSGIKVYEAGTTVEFDGNGVVIKATKS